MYYLLMKVAGIVKTIILFTLLIAEQSQSAKNDLLVQMKTKETDYLIVSSYYQDLIDLTKKNDLKTFCDSVGKIKPTLDQIFYDDQSLTKTLAQRSEPDFYEYSQHIDDNSRSELFANSSHLESCKNNQFEPREAFIQALQYSLMNVHYLSEMHQLWMQSHPK